jgi:hypothetical protein
MDSDLNVGTYLKISMAQFCGKTGTAPNLWISNFEKIKLHQLSKLGVRVNQHMCFP